jgi:hypothetical protein
MHDCRLESRGIFFITHWFQEQTDQGNRLALVVLLAAASEADPPLYHLNQNTS